MVAQKVRSTTRCRQVMFKVGPGCGSCTFDLPVSMTDTQALGKRRTDSCACSAAVPAARSLCHIEVAKDLPCTPLRVVLPLLEPSQIQV